MRNRENENIVITRAWLDGLIRKMAELQSTVEGCAFDLPGEQWRLRSSYYGLMGYIESAEEILKK